MMRSWQFVPLTILCLCLGVASILAEESSNQPITRNVIGSGETRELAVVNGLIEAVQQVKGVNISMVKTLRTEFTEVYAAKNGQENNSSEFLSSKVRDIVTKAKGLVQSYEITGEARKNEDGAWEVPLRVKLAHYRSPGISPDSRRRMAVMPLRTGASTFSVGPKEYSGAEVARQLGEKINARLTQTRRFTVLDRAYIAEHLDERDLLRSGDTPIAEQAKLGETLGTDYMLVGTLAELTLREMPYTIRLTNESGVRQEAAIKLDYRITVMATRQVKWADSIPLFLSDGELGHLAPARSPEMILDVLLDLTAQAVVNRALDNIYPIQIVSLGENGEVVLNQGGSSLEEGGQLEIFETGEQVKDPYTGESLGKVEKPIGVAEVTRVDAKLAYAHLVDGRPESLKKGNICRRLRRHEQPTAQEAPSGQEAPDGGVRLPFDRK